MERDIGMDTYKYMNRYVYIYIYTYIGQTKIPRLFERPGNRMVWPLRKVLLCEIKRYLDERDVIKVIMIERV